MLLAKRAYQGLSGGGLLSKEKLETELKEVFESRLTGTAGPLVEGEYPDDQTHLDEQDWQKMKNTLVRGFDQDADGQITQDEYCFFS